MDAKLQSACFLIADISGYTSFLAQVELDHAQDIIADLMDTVLRCLRPPFRLAKFEGDAVFLYATSGRIDGSAIEDAIDSACFAFRRRLRSIGQATSCECRACRRMQDLDLKFVVHHGEFIEQRMAGRKELAGRDVIVVHRLLKNDAAKRLDGHAYALFSDDCIRSLGIDAGAQGLTEHRETIEIIGDVTCWLRDLETAWHDETARKRTEVTPEQALMVIGFEIDAPRPAVWEYFTVPGLRPMWRGADEVRETTANGRRGAGTTNHCLHGRDTIIEEVIDWNPFDHLTLTTLLPMPGAPKVLMTYAFSEIPDPAGKDGATRIEIRVAKPKPKDMAFINEVGPHFQETITKEIEGLRRLLAAESADTDGEPGMPRSAARFLTQPVSAE